MHSKTTMKAHLFKDRSSPAPQGEWIATNNKIHRRAKRGVQKRVSQAPMAEPQCQDLTSDSDRKPLGLSSVL